MSRVLFLVNHEIVIYNFRLEIIERLLNDGHRVIISSPGGSRIEKLKELGCLHENLSIDRHGKNPLKDIALLVTYLKLIKKVKPDIVFSFTIKPNIYGSIASRVLKIPCVVNVTGLGTAVEGGGLLQKITVLMYKYALKDVQRVFFQNKENEQFFRNNHIAKGRHKIIPGSGVNLNKFAVKEYPSIEGVGKRKRIKFAFISRIMKEKGINEYLKAAYLIKSRYPNAEFHVCGFCEDGTNYYRLLMKYHEKGIIIYHGMIDDVAEMMQTMHCIVHPTYYPEGISNVLLEACACARPIITTGRTGCREVVDDGENGYIVKEKAPKDLADKMERIINCSWEKLKSMGLKARKKVENCFDRERVVNAYIDEIKML